MPEQQIPGEILDVIVAFSKGLLDTNIEFAIGGAFALSFWGTPRATVDVYATIYPLDSSVSAVIDFLRQLGCRFDARSTADSLSEHSFARVQFHQTDMDVFLPMIEFYEQARIRRREVSVRGQPIWIWDAETLCVFKLMFFRLKDLADVEDVLRVQGSRLDRDWVGDQLKFIYGMRDPRCTRWQELCDAIA